MKINFKLLICALLLISIACCTPQDKNKAADKKSAPARPKNFERVTPPLMIANDHKAIAAYMVMHFWDNFNFRDTMYCHVPEISEQAFSDYIYIFDYTTTEKISEGVHKMLDSASVEPLMYQYFFKLAEHYLYHPNSRLRNDEYYIPFLEHITSLRDLPEEMKIRPKYQLALAYKNRPGEKANNLTYTLSNGKTGTLYEVSAKYTLLMFYNPGCKECQNAKNEIKNTPVISDAVSAGKLKIVAVYPDENIESWKSHLGDIPTSWINGYDLSLSVKNNELYDLKAIPTLILLDKDKKVIFKDTSVGHINEYLSKDQ